MATIRQECDATNNRVPASCTGSYLRYTDRVQTLQHFSGVVLFTALSQPRPGQANMFQMVLRGLAHIAQCVPAGTEGRSFRLQELGDCLLAGFQADGAFNFAGGSFRVSTVVVMPQATAKLAAAEGHLLKWAGPTVRAAASSGKFRIVSLVILGAVVSS